MIDKNGLRAPLKKYLALMDEHPEFFVNTGEPGEIKIITNLERILAEQKRIQTELHTKGQPEEWIEIGVLSEDQWFWVVRDMVDFPNGVVGGYIRWINRKSQGDGGFNSILMCVQGDQVLMIRKYRHEERGWVWEFPRGFGEPELSAEENALTELREEIGIKVDESHLHLLTEVREGKGGTAVFYVEIPPEKNITLEAGEGIAGSRWVSMKELDEFVKQGQLSDWFSLWAYALVKGQR